MHTTFKLNIFKLSTQYVDFSTAIYGAFEPHTHTWRSSCQTLGVGPLASLWRSLHLLSSWTSDSVVGLGREAQLQLGISLGLFRPGIRS